MQFNARVIHLAPSTRRILLVLAAVLTLTSTNIQVAQAQEVLPDPPTWLTNSPVSHETDATSTGITVPPVQVKGDDPQEDTPKPERPPRKKWQRVKGPDLETQADHSDEPAVRTIVVSTTAYTSDPRETDATPFTTANGTQVFDGVVATNFLKFGTRIRIPDYFGDKVFEVHDRMNPRFSNRIDIWMLKKTDARAWGIRRVKIEVLPQS